MKITPAELPKAPQVRHSLARIEGALAKPEVRDGEKKLRAPEGGTSSLRQFLIPKTTHLVIIYHANRLHESVTNRRPNKLESAFEQVFTHLLRLSSLGGQSLFGLPRINDRLAIHKLPSVFVKTAKLFLHRQER